MQTLWESETFVAVDKPHGWLSVPSRLGDKDARKCAGLELQQKYGRVWPVHRLDVEVGGVLLFARTSEAHKEACLWFERHQAKKTYRALTAGSPPVGWNAGESRAIEFKLVRGKKRSFEAKHGDLAITNVKLLGSRGGHLEWELSPQTGRAHQLRLTLSKLGYPILGDALYGSAEKWRDGAIALRAVRLEFPGITYPGLPPSAIEAAGL